MFAIGRVFGPITRSSLILLSAHESKYTIHSTMSKKRRPRLSRSEFPARSRNPQHIDREGGIFKRGGHRRGCHSFLRAISTMTSWDTATPPSSRASTSGSSARRCCLISSSSASAQPKTPSSFEAPTSSRHTGNRFCHAAPLMNALGLMGHPTLVTLLGSQFRKKGACLSGHFPLQSSYVTVVPTMTATLPVAHFPYR